MLELKYFIYNQIIEYVPSYYLCMEMEDSK